MFAVMIASMAVGFSTMYFNGFKEYHQSISFYNTALTVVALTAAGAAISYLVWFILRRKKIDKLATLQEQEMILSSRALSLIMMMMFSTFASGLSIAIAIIHVCVIFKTPQIQWLLSTAISAVFGYVYLRSIKRVMKHTDWEHRGDQSGSHPRTFKRLLGRWDQ